jgi:hypothetical protein
MELVGPALCRLALHKSGECETASAIEEVSHEPALGEFKHSAALSLGVELELQLVSKRDFDLTRGATDLLGSLNTTNVSAKSSLKSPKA